MIDYTYLSKIDSPDDLKSLDAKTLKVLSTELTHFIRSTVEEVGGHFASPLGVVDLAIALHSVYNSPHDKLIWDVGHQAYAHKILTGRRDVFSTLRQKDGISGYLNRSESPHDIVGAGHASTAISSALGLAHARDRKKSNENIIAIVGDGAMSGGLSYEGINNLGFHRTQMTIVLNDNTMSISKSVGALSKYLTKVVTSPVYNRMRNDIWNITGKAPTTISRIVRKLLRKTEEGVKGFFTPGALFEELGLRYIGPVNGHDLDELLRTFKAVKKMPNPVLVHVYTKKGKGSELAEIDSTKYYSMAGNRKKTEKPAPDYSQVFGSSVVKLAEKNDKIICVTAAMEVGTGMSTYVNKFPKRYVDVGIAEGHAVTYASGLAIEKYRPIVAIYSTFFQRAIDNIFHDVLLQDLPVIFCMDRAGVVGQDGPTHHGIFDISLLRMFPNIVITAPKDGDEMNDLLATALSQQKPFSIRYPKDTSYRFDENRESKVINVGEWEVLNEGSNVAILAVGSMVEIAQNSLKKIKEILGFTPTVVNARFIKPMDENLLKEVLSKYESILTIEEGSLIGGFGSGVVDFAKGIKSNSNILTMGIPDNYVEHATRSELLDILQLNTAGIINKLKEFNSAK
ncbi:MAG: 1-deoxy-D-xylulose-5-phosphate synthase [Candidatus Marinimicrobia bacterium]|nr:1-deoxy-D-xylulose-5-phosphate synthase [Candidatus Neomarinimicrobiota bacterium]MBL7022730.1 1-deoxy-D-xylulose-5-phosphate synthase [Candidatus Neomarinimicrobiota bacterium]MBL7109141.1 1-deoxy-D-xylulose-5-phosphate synthase [Candidatus Neomarinimicrobiota bacterium]